MIHARKSSTDSRAAYSANWDRIFGKGKAMTSKNLHTKTRNRLARQDALREYMQERGSVQYLFDIIEKIEKLDPESETFQQDWQVL